MKKSWHILLSMLMMVPMLVGICFLTPNNAPATLNGGGGANSLDSPIAGDTDAFNEENDNQTGKTLSSVIYKSKAEYFIDFFNMPQGIYTTDAETGEVTIDYSQITRKKINTDTQLLYGDSVFDTITKEDLTGSGTKSDPYVVHSTKGFLYLQGNGISGLNIDNKYFELACDVVLNDESYDDNGNPISGDGVVYKWEPINYGRNAFFDGKNHSIKGLYLHRPENTYQGLFDARVTIKSCKNLSMENFYIHGKSWVYSLCSHIGLAENLTNRKGTLRGYQMGGIAGSATNAYNCNNYANLYATNYDMGGCFLGGTYLENCNNYGKIDGKQNMGGIVRSATTLVNCKNYGEIISSSSSAGGIAGYGVSQLIGCENYGKIKHSASCGGGLVGQQSKDIFIKDCANYGDFNTLTNTRGSFIGWVSGVCKITIVSSKSFSNIWLIGYLYVEGCTLRIDGLEMKGHGMIANAYQPKTTIEAKNIYVDYTYTNSSKILFDSKKTGCNINVKNVIVNFYEDSLTNTNYVSPYASDFDGVVIQNFGKGKEKYYYGENFGQHNFSWKTGKISLNKMAGNGFYQQRLSKQYLLDNDFVQMKL